MGKFIDLTHQKFGDLIVLEYVGKNTQNRALWKCLCESCGKEKTIRSDALLGGASKTCGCRHMDLTGKRFGKLSVLEQIGSHISGKNTTRRLWKCRCDCGNLTEVQSNYLVNGETKSCGCYRKSGEARVTHGAQKKENKYTALNQAYIAWCNMKSICLNPNNNRYFEFGEKGITVSLNWNKFENFIKDMGEPHTIFRPKVELINESGNFEKGNAIWAQSRLSGNSIQAINLFSVIVNETGIKNAFFYDDKNNKEKVITSNGVRYKPDFIYENKIIEYYGDFWHFNPNKYSKDDIVEMLENKIKVSDKWTLDEIRIKALKKIGYEVLIIWESEYKENPIDIIKKCINFLNLPDKKEYIYSNFYNEFNTWIMNNFPNVFIRYNLNGYNIEYYNKEKQFGINVLNLYDIGEKNLNHRAHIKKYIEYRQHGIKILNIFEDEFYNKVSILRNIIKTKLGIQEKSIGARKLIIKPISSIIAKPFIEEYHIQGSNTILSICLGAYKDETLVGVMGFGHPTRQSEYQYELKRYCTNHKIYPGLASRLFQYFIKTYNPSSVVSFCDNRFFNGETYIKMGFVNDGEIPPDGFYTNDYKIRHYKSKFKKSLLKKKLGIEIDNKTEWSIMQEMGYDRIWDVGKIRFVWKNRRSLCRKI